MREERATHARGERGACSVAPVADDPQLGEDRDDDRVLEDAEKTSDPAKAKAAQEK